MRPSTRGVRDGGMNGLLQDLRIVEISAFVAAPLGGMTMAQMGADVIRVDPIGGGIDHARWPVARGGASLYWAGLNKAKRSLALALDKPEGRDIARALITAPGAGGGIVLTNLPPLRGRDFATADGRRVMIIALTRRQWRAIGEATGLGERLAMIGPMMDVDLDTEAGRYEARDAIGALLARWCARHSLDEIRRAFSGTGVLWGRFQDFSQLVRDDPRCSAASPPFAAADQLGVGRYLTPGLPPYAAAATP